MTLEVKSTVSVSSDVEPRPIAGGRVVAFYSEESYDLSELFAAAAVWTHNNPNMLVIGVAFSYHDDGTELLLTVE